MNTAGWPKHDLDNPPNLQQSRYGVFLRRWHELDLRINAYGEMGICVISQQETFRCSRDWAEAGLGRLADGDANRASARSVTKCMQCRIQSLCGMCPANGEMENGDRESPVEFLCNVRTSAGGGNWIDVPAHGECDFCAGGDRARDTSWSRREAIAEQGDRRRELGRDRNSILPILNNTTVATGGCGSCGGH